MPVCAFYHLKGGVGKTTTAVNIAHLASRSIGPTLLCDLDAQASASWYFRIRPDDEFSAKRMLKGGKHIDRNIRESDYPDLFLLPADFSYRHLDLKLDQEKHRKRRLAEIIKPLAAEFELVIIDAPPNITLESENIFRATDFLFVPVIPSPLSVASYQTFKDHLDPKQLGEAHIRVFFNLVDRRRKLHREMIESPPPELGRVCRTPIPYSTHIEQMGVKREPITAFSPSSAPAKAYRDLWEELRSLLFPTR